MRRMKENPKSCDTTLHAIYLFNYNIIYNFGKTGTRDARLFSFWIGWMKLEESVWRQREGKSIETAKKEM